MRSAATEAAMADAAAAGEMAASAQSEAMAESEKLAEAAQVVERMEEGAGKVAASRALEQRATVVAALGGWARARAYVASAAMGKCQQAHPSGQPPRP